MESLFNAPWLSSHSTTILSFLLHLSLKCSLILLTAYLFTRILRHSSSATRHLLWSMVLASILLLPIFSVILPSWNIPGLSNFLPDKQENREPILSEPASGSVQKVTEPEIPPSKHFEKRATRLDDKEDLKGLVQDSKTPSKPISDTIQEKIRLLISTISLKHGSMMLIFIWSFGVIVIFVRQLVGKIFVWWMARQAETVTEKSWLNLSDDLTDHLQILRPIRLLKSDKIKMPMTWGISHPKIMFPSEADHWSHERRRFVLLHEFAHVKRLDSLTQLLAQFANALYWFNPFIWISIRQFLKEREHACDDFVLKQGSKASEYAGLLLDIAQSLSSVPFASLATVAMARRTQLEGRLLAILNPHLSRRTLTRFAVLLISIGVLSIVLPLSAMRPISQSKKHTDTKSAQQDQEILKSSEGEKNLEHEIENNTNAGPALPIKIFHQQTKTTKTNKIQTGPVQQSDDLVVQSLCEALKDSILEVRLQAAETLGRIKNPAAVQPLAEALKDKNWQMRVTAAEALGDIGDKSAVQALIAALGDANWQVRCRAAEALGDIEDPRAVKPLGEALRDENRDVRQNVVQALSEIEDHSAVDPLTTALKDDDWEIRKEAAHALGEIEDPAAVSPLSLALTDENWEVRKSVVHALGEIGDRRAVEPLSKAMMDEDWEIRKQAAYALGEIEDPSAVNTLSTAINDASVEVRKTVVWALGEIEDASAVKPLIQALRDKNWEIRKEAAEALGNIEDASAVDALSTSLEDENKEVRKTVIWALGEIEDSRAVKPLAALLDDPDWEIRMKTAQALGEIDDPAAASALSKILKDENPDVRKMAIWAIGEIEGRVAVESLIEALNDEDWEIREKAVWALGEIGDPRALEPLSTKLKDENEEVRRAAARALGEIRWRDE